MACVGMQLKIEPGSFYLVFFLSPDSVLGSHFIVTVEETRRRRQRPIRRARLCGMPEIISIVWVG